MLTSHQTKAIHVIDHMVKGFVAYTLALETAAAVIVIALLVVTNDDVAYLTMQPAIKQLNQ